MATMDIFKGDAFSMMSLTTAFEDIPYKPGLLRSRGLFSFNGIRTRQFGIENRGGVLTLIPFSDPRGPATQGNQNGEARNLRYFGTRHFKKENTLWASEVAGIRAFGSESELTQVQAELARRAQRLRNEAELTFEYHMLNAIQGLVKDPGTGSTVYNWYTEFGITPADEIDFDLDNTSAAKGALRKKCHTVIESVEESLGGLVSSVSLLALCGSNFWSDLTSHKDVIDAYEAAARFADLSGGPKDQFEWGGITWLRYRGGSNVSVNTDKCYIVPLGVPDMFEQYASPTEDFEFVNTPGQESYYRLIPDQDRNQFVKIELEANPMFVCTRPGALRTGKRT